MSQKTPELEELVDFPSRFTFRVVAASAEGLAERCAGHVRLAIGREISEVIERPSAKGSYRAVRVVAVVESADEIRAAYAALGTEPGIKLLL